MRLREVHSVYRTVAGTPTGPRPVISTARGAVDVLAPFFDGSLVERFGVLTLDTKHRVTGWDVLSVGTLDATVVHPRDVFRVAILQNAGALIVAHNHPSGDPTPSPDDVELTRRLRAAGIVMGIDLIDHIVIGEAGSYASFRERGEL
jgi:DNA repair protein RadC